MRIPPLWGGKVLHPRTLKMCAGPKPARTGEQSIGTLCSRKQTSETVCDAALSECESTRPSNPRTQTSPRGESAPGSASALHPERTFAKRSVDGSEIQNWAKPPIPLGYHEVAAVKPALQLVWWDSLYCSFLEQTANLLPQSLGISRRC